MQIVKLEAQNVKRLTAVEIEPDGSLVVVGGRNGAGKTSVLDSIAYALGGKALCPSKPIREGQEKAVIKVDLGEFTVERTFTAKDSYLTLKTKDGARYDKPQAILDGLVGTLTFDPLAFANRRPVDQAETLKRLVGLDLSEMDAARAEAYAQRTDANRGVKELQARLKAMPVHEDVPAEPVSVSGLMDELRVREEANRANDAQREKLEQLRNQAKQAQADRDRLKVQVEALTKELEAEEVALQEIGKNGKALAAKVDKLEDADVAEIRRQIAAADGINEQVRVNQAREQLVQTLQENEERAADLDAQIKEIDQQKADALAAAEFPVDGLSFDEDGVTFNGLPFEQSSQAEKLRVSVAMGLAMNPKLRVMLIRDGSLLDEENLELIARMAEENDAQIWIERVGAGAEVSVLIEDGMVAKAPGEVAA